MHKGHYMLSRLQGPESSRSLLSSDDFDDYARPGSSYSGVTEDSYGSFAQPPGSAQARARGLPSLTRFPSDLAGDALGQISSAAAVYSSYLDTHSGLFSRGSQGSGWTSSNDDRMDGRALLQGDASISLLSFTDEEPEFGI